jgi:phosphotransferase system enzyme I (PtsI)
MEQTCSPCRFRLELSGLPASPGVAVGPASILERHGVQVLRETIAKVEVEAEQRAARAALRAVQCELERAKGRLPHGEHAQILDAQKAMLKDPDLGARIDEAILGGHAAPWAITEAFGEIEAALTQVEDDLIRERGHDIPGLCERAVRQLVGADDVPQSMEAGSVVMAGRLDVAEAVALAEQDVAAVVLAVGTQTSHVAITLRSLGIPAVLGVVHLLDAAEPGDPVVVDGSQGLVIVRPSPSEIKVWKKEHDRYEAFEARLSAERDLPARTRDGVEVVLRANAALDEEVEAALASGAAGIGLVRTEMLFLERTEPPTEEEHYEHARRVLAAMAGQPVTFRTFDLGGDKPCAFLEHPENEPNPALGVRGLRLALRQRDVLLAQLRGLLRAAQDGPLRIMFPLVGGMDDLHAALEAVREAEGQLPKAGVHLPEKVPIGVMIETPGAALVADALARQVDFLSIGTNDLVQYTLAVDRDNAAVGELYDPLHPAVLRLIDMVVQAGRRASIPVSVCGEMAGNPLFTWVLVGLGVREMSVRAPSVPLVKNVIRRSSLAEMRALARAVVKMYSADEVRAVVMEAMRRRFAEHILHGANRSAAAA